MNPLLETAAAFLRLGLMSFGGPVAHLGYFHAEFVERRRWIDTEAFADLVALCQFLPGPASSQVAFALGLRRAGWAGAVVASLCFLLPSAAIMIGLGYSMSSWAGNGASEGAMGVLAGLKIAAVAVVAQAVWGMWSKLCLDWPRRTLALGAAGTTLLFPGVAKFLPTLANVAPAAMVITIIIAALLGSRFVTLPARSDGLPEPEAKMAQRRWGAAALVTFAALLLLPSIVVTIWPTREIELFDKFYRSGALVFGGGHVVLPLLRSELVPPKLLSDDSFLAGYGAAQALPGPLFAFAGFLGTVIYAGPNAWLGGLGCILAVFLPGWLVVAGAIPFWQRICAIPAAAASMAGANAAVVGVLLAALITPVGTESLKRPTDFFVAFIAFGVLQFMKAPPIVVVALCAASGWVSA